jgi:hypothetical protein
MKSQPLPTQKKSQDAGNQPESTDIMKVFPGRGSPFARIAKEWFAVVHKYGDSFKRPWMDFHWRYGERTHVGMFAAAIWRSGGVALEEYVTEKLDQQSAVYAGRCDLYFYFEGKRFLVEAKQVNFELSDQTRSMKKLKLAIQSAKRDGRKLDIDDGEQALAVVFVTFKAPKNQSEHTTTDQIRELLGEFRDGLPLRSTCDSAALYFPKHFRGRPDREPEHLPGAGIFIREVGKRNS